MRFFKIILSLCFLLCLCTGCNSHKRYITESDFSQEATLPSENLLAVNTEALTNFVPNYNGAGFYKASSILEFYDPASDVTEPVVLCSKVGCEHRDNTCTAYLGANVAFAAYGDMWYNFTKNNQDELQLVSIEPTTGMRNVIYTWANENGNGSDYGNALFSYGFAYVDVTYWTEDDFFTVLDCIDLTTGRCKTLFENTSKDYYSLLGTSGTSSAVLCTYYPDYIMTLQNWLDNGGNINEYEDYLSEVSGTTELRIYSLDTLEYQIIASNKYGFVPSIDPNVVYGNQLIYLSDDNLYVYDLDSGTQTLLTKQPGVVNYWLMDYRAFLIYSNQKGEYKIDLVSLESNERTPLNNGGHTDGMTFSVCVETCDGFIGVYQDSIYWISKSAFYHADFKTAVPLN